MVTLKSCNCGVVGLKSNLGILLLQIVFNEIKLTILIYLWNTAVLINNLAMHITHANICLLSRKLKLPGWHTKKKKVIPAAILQ